MPRRRRNAHFGTDSSGKVYWDHDEKFPPKKRTKKKNPLLVVTRKNGKRVRSNATVSMPLKSLRRLISSARTGKRTSTKVRVRP